MLITCTLTVNEYETLKALATSVLRWRPLQVILVVIAPRALA
jgi:hypothetical protein